MAGQPENQKESALATVGFGRAGIQLRTFDEVWRFANVAIKSNFAPKGMTLEDAVCAIQLGSEVGLSAMSALQRIAVINGRPSVWGDALLGICQRSGRFDHGAFRESFEGEPYKDDYTAVCFVKRIGSEGGVESRYSVADAKKAKLWDKQGTWQTNPKRMLKYRARAFALRDAFADVVTGLYDRDEMLDADIVEGRVIDARDVTRPTDAAIEAGLRKQPEEAQARAVAEGLKMVSGALESPQAAPVASDAPTALSAAESAAQPMPAAPTTTEKPIGKESDLYKKLHRSFDTLNDKQRVDVRRELGVASIKTIAGWNDLDANDALVVIRAKCAETEAASPAAKE